MASSGPEPQPALVPPRVHRVLVAILLAAAAAFGVAGIVGDSATVDEPVHLVAAVVHMRTGDAHLTVDHPPLARDLAALPLLFMNVNLPDRTSAAYRAGEFGAVGREFFYEKNDGEKLLAPARAVTVVFWLILALV